jgi:DNA-binding IclR family transcriptional regulator
MNTSREGGGPVASTVITAAIILEYIAERGRVLPRDLAADLSLNRSTVHRMLYTLELLNYVGKLADGSYRLTFHLFEIGNSVPNSHNLIDTARRELLQLSQDTGLTVNHGILYDDQVLYVDKVTPSTYLQLDRSVGESEPLHCTSIGKVLLAFSSEDTREVLMARMQFERFTENTITSAALLREELRRILSRGYAVDQQELSLEIRCVAVPVLDDSGAPISGVSISGPEDRLSADVVESFLPRLKDTARTIMVNMSTAAKNVEPPTRPDLSD